MSEVPRWTPLEDRGVLEIAGTEARPFLQGLISNDIEALTPTRSIYAALLTPQGKYLFDFILYQRDDQILLETEAARLAELHQRLTLYRLRAKVTIEDASDRLSGAVAFGREALEVLDLPADPGAARQEGDVIMATDPRTPDLGARFLGPADATQALAERCGLATAVPESYDLHRLYLGVPDGSRDLVVQKSTLIESNFEELHGISFTKGCFVGQELTARMKYRGLRKKQIVPISFEGPPPPAGTPILSGEREVGEIRSHRGSYALALMRIDALEDDKAPLHAGEAMVQIPDRNAPR